MSSDLSSNAPEFSVIIPHFNQPDGLRKCLFSVLNQTIEQERMEIIVADNNSDCDITALKRDYPSVQFLSVEMRGAALARNAGIYASRGKILAFIDADCVADPRWLECGAKSLLDCDLSGGEVVVTVANESKPSAVESFERVFAFRQRIYINRKQFSVTANLLATREAAIAIGPFKNGVSEDVDWCRRAAALGFRLAFNDTSIISHPARRNWEDLTKKWDRLILERWNGYGGRSLIRRMVWAVLATATALSAVPHMAWILSSKRIRGVRDKLAAVGVLARIRFWRARRMLAML